MKKERKKDEKAERRREDRLFGGASSTSPEKRDLNLEVFMAPQLRVSLETGDK